jgi:hypothetical protein
MKCKTQVQKKLRMVNSLANLGVSAFQIDSIVELKAINGFIVKQASAEMET